jgi:hypothetical protein
MATQWTAGLSAGQGLTAATLNTIGAAWESYTPTWTAAGTNPNIGNGSISGQWARIQKIGLVNIFVVMGSTTTYGTSGWRFSMPSTLSINGNNTHCGNAIMFDASAGYTTSIGAIGRVSGSTIEINPQGFYNASSTAPFTWGTNDQVRIMCVFQAD